MRIGVTISRDWDDYDAVVNALIAETIGMNNRDITVVHGASQMDWFIAGVAHAYDMHTDPHPADWNAYRGQRPNPAGFIRNQEMVDSGADVWLAFIKNNSSGATDCAERVERADIPTRRYTR